MAPTSWPKRRDTGPMPRGLSLARRIDAIDLPYMKARANGHSAKKSGEFMDLRRDRDEQAQVLFTYLWGDVLGEASFTTGGYNPEQHFKRLSTYGTVIGAGYSLPTSFSFYVGDKYILRLASDGANAYWPVTVQPTLGDEYPPNISNAGRSISYHATAKLEGGAALTEFQHALTLWASGWDGSAYRFGFGGLWRATPATTVLLTGGGPIDGQTAFTRQTQEYRVWAGNVGDFTVDDSVLAAAAGRECTAARVQVAGPGRVIALQATMEQLASTGWVLTDTPNPGDGYYTGTWDAYVAPRIWRSTDHGSSWSSYEATFLAPYIGQLDFQIPPWSTSGILAANYDRLLYDNQQMALMALGARFIYCGGDTVLLIVPACKLAADTYATLLFRSTDGGASFSRVNWLPDAWTATLDGVPTPNVTSFVGYAYNLHWSLGDGHAFVPTKHADGVRMLYTTDHGSTWTLSGVVPPTYVPAFTDAFFPTVIAPGKGVVATLDTVDERVGWARFGPDFSAYVALGTVSVADADDDLIGYAGRTFAYVGDGINRQRYVHPAFPGAFDRP